MTDDQKRALVLFAGMLAMAFAVGTPVKGILR